MQQRQQQGDARRRQPQTGQQRSAEAEQQDRLEMAETGEILRSPFADQAHRRPKLQNVARGDVNTPAIGMDQRRQTAGEREAEPAQGQRSARGNRPRQRFPGEKGDQDESQQEGAMKIGPKRDEQRGRPARRAALLCRVQQVCGEDRRDGPGQDVGPREQMEIAGERHGEDRSKREGRAGAPLDLREDHGEGGAGRRERQQRRPRPTAKLDRKRVQNLRQPFLGDPEAPGHGPGISVRHREMARGEDVLPGADMPE